VDAKIKAVQAGFTTVGKVIAETADGDDLEDILEARHAELELMEEMDLAFTTDPASAAPEMPAAPAKPEATDPEDPADPDESDDGESEAAAPAAGRVIPMR
jgi:capsid protein